MTYYSEEPAKTFKWFNKSNKIIDETPFNKTSTDLYNGSINEISDCESNNSFFQFLDDLLASGNNDDEPRPIEKYTKKDENFLDFQIFSENKQKRQRKMNPEVHSLSTVHDNAPINFFNRINTSKIMKGEDRYDNMAGISIIENDDYLQYEKTRGTKRKIEKSTKYEIFNKKVEYFPRFVV